MKDIVVLAGTTPYSVLSLCKIAYKNKVRAFCICLDFKKPNDYYLSKYVFRSYDIRSKNIKSFLESFFEKYKFNEKPILYTTTDNSCILVDANREYFTNLFDLCIPSSYIVQSFNNKAIAGKEAIKNGLIIPKSIYIEKESDVNKVIETFHFPIILKPKSANDFNKIGFKFRILNDIQSFKANILEILKNKTPILCQEYILGDDSQYKFYIFYRNKKGSIIECMGEKTLQINGIMTIGTTKSDLLLRQICRNFLNKIDYVGIGGLEFKKYKDQYFFIEMSTRTEGFLPISDIAGASISDSSYNDMNRYPFKCVTQKENYKYIVFKSLVYFYLTTKNIRRGFLNILKYILDPNSKFISSYLDLRYTLIQYIRQIKNKL